MLLKRLSLIVLPFILLLFLYSLQVHTQLAHIRKLPAPGWSRPLNASIPVETSITPYTFQTDNTIHLYTAKGSVITQTDMSPKLDVSHQFNYSVQGPVQSVLWANGQDFIYQKDHGLYYYKNLNTASKDVGKGSKTKKITGNFDEAASTQQYLLFSKTIHLYEFIPKNGNVSEIAGFASPVIAIDQAKTDQALLVTTQNPKSRQLTFFLLTNQGDKGYAPLKLGWINPKEGQTLLTSQVTKTKSNYFILIAFKNKNGQTELETVQLPAKKVEQGAVWHPKAQPLVIKYEKTTLSQLNGIQLSSDSNGEPSLLFVGSQLDHLNHQILSAQPSKSGAWMAETRTSSFLTKAQPFWVDPLSLQLVGWLTPHSHDSSLIQFTSHDPKLAAKSLQVTSTDLMHAVQDTTHNIWTMERFLLLLILFGIPALLIYIILDKWRGTEVDHRFLFTGTLGVFLISEMDLIHYVLQAKTYIPHYLDFPYNAVAFGLGAALVSGLVTWVLSPDNWSLRSKLVYSFTLYFLLLTFLVGPY